MHFINIDFEITDETKCKVIQTGGGNIIKNVGEFKARSLQYYKDHKGSRFPPSYYLPEDSTRQWAEKMDFYLEAFPSRKILVGYDPTIHVQLLGLEINESEQIINLPGATFDNMVIVINPESRWIMVSAVTDKIDLASIELELRKVDIVLKTILVSNMNIECIAMVGALVCPNINSFKGLQYHQTSTKAPMNLKMLSVTKEELDSETLFNNWLRNITKKIESDLQGNCLDLEKQSIKSLETLSGTMMASMAQTSLYLPKMTHHIPTKITTILMNQYQIEIVQDPAKWKIISAPFGGGKTVVLAEIAKNLLKVYIKCYFKKYL